MALRDRQAAGPRGLSITEIRTFLAGALVAVAVAAVVTMAVMVRW